MIIILASNLVSFAPKFFALTIPLLQIAPTNITNNIGVKKCITLVMMCVDFILNTEIDISSQQPFKIVSFAWDIMTLLYEEGINLLYNAF